MVRGHAVRAAHAQSSREARLAAPHQERECRAGHFLSAAGALRLGRRRAGRAAGDRAARRARPSADAVFQRRCGARARGARSCRRPTGRLERARPSAHPLGASPRRTRIISGCALGVLVVEAALRSGSLITARFALEQGREVFAVPGSPLDPRCRGTNDLIRRGAALTETAEDILAQIEVQLKPAPAGRRDPALEGPEPAPAGEGEVAAARRRVLERLSPSPVPVHGLILESQLTPALTLNHLLELELAGRLERQPGNLVALL